MTKIRLFVVVLIAALFGVACGAQGGASRAPVEMSSATATAETIPVFVPPDSAAWIVKDGFSTEKHLIDNWIANAQQVNPDSICGGLKTFADKYFDQEMLIVDISSPMTKPTSVVNCAMWNAQMFSCDWASGPPNLIRPGDKMPMTTEVPVIVTTTIAAPLDWTNFAPGAKDSIDAAVEAKDCQTLWAYWSTAVEDLGSQALGDYVAAGQANAGC